MFICSAGFYGIHGNPLLLLNFAGQDVVIGISLVLLILTRFNIPFYLLSNFRYIIILCLYCFFISPMMALINFNQPYFFSFSSSRLFIAYSILLFSLISVFIKVKVKEQLINLILIIVAVFLFLINFYVFISENFDLIENLRVLERFGEVRFMIGGGTVICLTIYFFKNRNFSKINYFILFLLISVLLVISKTRGIIIPLTIVFCITFFKEIKKSNLGKSIFMFSFVFFLSSLFFDVTVLGEYFGKIISFTGSDFKSRSGEYAFRTEELFFFISKLDLPSLIFGYGMDNTNFVKLYANENTRYYLSDLGVFSIFYYHGLVGFVLFVIFFYNFYKDCCIHNTIYHSFGKGFVLFQLFSFTTLSFYHSIEMVSILIFIYVNVVFINRGRFNNKVQQNKI